MTGFLFRPVTFQFSIISRKMFVTLVILSVLIYTWMKAPKVIDNSEIHSCLRSHLLRDDNTSSSRPSEYLFPCCRRQNCDKKSREVTESCQPRTVTWTDLWYKVTNWFSASALATQSYAYCTAAAFSLTTRGFSSKVNRHCAHFRDSLQNNQRHQ
jgi:hypothetical protein